ncbi:MAG: response regulator, partial [Chloroflexi bacterium]|nr:response regulator [Chloroflexota bacterium]
MAKPVVLTVDDDPDVLRAVERDLRRRYGDRYRIVRADSGKAALDALGKLKLRNDQVALFVADQRMPEMSGVEFLQEARRIFPNAKSTLLTAYADTEAAIQAINLLRLDFYLLKPWDPPDERLYPVIDDLLDDWERSNTPPFEGLRVVGPRRTLRGHEVRDFLSRYRVPYVWIDITTEEAGRLLEQIGPERPRLPLVLFSDGSYLGDPSQSELADKLGLKTRPEHRFYDVIVVGAGPAGLAAGVYGASEGLETAIIERDSPGGQAGMSSRIENYLGFPTGLSGADLAQRAVIQARRLGAEILAPQTVVGLRREDPYRIVSLADGSELSCHALLVATGVSYRWLEVPGMDRLTGAGIYYG